MRISVLIQSGFVLFVAVGAWIRPLSATRRLKIVSMAGGTIAAILLTRLTVYSHGIYDWLPAALLLVPYWQIGQFFISPSQKAQYRLAAFDRMLLKIIFSHPRRSLLWPALDLYFELAYLIVYPLIPAGLAVLYAAGQRHHADHYWVIILLATYVCLAITPWVPALPPRVLTSFPQAHHDNRVRLLNQWILRQASIQAITFPSAHVAAAAAASLVLLKLVPWVGLAFTWLTVSIAVAAVAGGYHYAADILLALIVAVLVFVSLHWLF